MLLLILCGCHNSVKLRNRKSEEVVSLVSNNVWRNTDTVEVFARGRIVARRGKSERGAVLKGYRALHNTFFEGDLANAG